MAAEWDKHVRPRWTTVLDNFVFSERLEAALITVGLVSRDDLETVKSKKTDLGRKERLIWEYLAKKGQGSLLKFCKALENSGNENLAKDLRDSLRGGPSHADSSAETDIGKIADRKDLAVTEKVFPDIFRSSNKPGNEELSEELIDSRLSSIKESYKKNDEEGRWDYDIFLCFSGDESRDLCTRLFNELQKRGLKPFLDKKSITGGLSIVDALLNALGRSKYVAVFLSKGMKGSSHPEAEATVALEVHSKYGRLLPIFHTMSPANCASNTVKVFLPSSNRHLYQEIGKLVGEDLTAMPISNREEICAEFITKTLKGDSWQPAKQQQFGVLDLLVTHKKTLCTVLLCLMIAFLAFWIGRLGS
eukprot:m.15039 g.15039  ORF g.15039 m.15039 type:complete len:361 (+) comp26136_c0_seq1:341-1423(+)